MFTKCRFCPYRVETPLSGAILRVLIDEDLPEEDFRPWVRRLIVTAGHKGWNSVKIHMGMKHKLDTYKGIWPDLEFSDMERAILTNHKNYATLKT